MKFEHAIAEVLRSYSAVRRADWGPGKFVQLYYCNDERMTPSPMVAMFYKNAWTPFQPSQTDMCAADWGVLDFNEVAAIVEEAEEAAAAPQVVATPVANSVTRKKKARSNARRR